MGRGLQHIQIGHVDQRIPPRADVAGVRAALREGRRARSTSSQTRSFAPCGRVMAGGGWSFFVEAQPLQTRLDGVSGYSAEPVCKPVQPRKAAIQPRDGAVPSRSYARRDCNRERVGVVFTVHSPTGISIPATETNSK